MLFIFPLFYLFIGAIIGIVIINRKTASGMNEVSEAPSPLADKKTKLMLTLYLLITSVAFTYLCMPESSGLGITVFALLQLIFISLIIKKPRTTLFLTLCFLISTNYFTSNSPLWKSINIPVIFILAVIAVSPFGMGDSTLFIIKRTVSEAIRPFGFIFLPFRWLREINGGKAGLFKRIILAVIITVPASLILIYMLSGADMVFSAAAESLRECLSGYLSFNVFIKGIAGIITGFYLFGVLCLKYSPSKLTRSEPKERRGDLLIINIFLCAVLIIYSLFIFIQFRYLFAANKLPYGLTYTEYARKGFFELLALTGINIAIILAVTVLTKSCEKKKFTVILCMYLCAVTLIMLASSFYRMYLYTDYDGLTRLRLFVFIFLGFEAIGLIFTFAYIIKPCFNPVAVYMVICIIYYTALNLIPSDYIIAENQVNRYISGERDDIDYVFSLSEDAAPSLEKLYITTDSPELKERIKDCFIYRWKTERKIPNRWQRFNLSHHKATNIFNSIN